MVKYLIILLSLNLISCWSRQEPIVSCDTYKVEIDNLNSKITELENQIIDLESELREKTSEGESADPIDGSLKNSSFVRFRVVFYPDNCNYMILKHVSTSTFIFARLIKGMVPEVEDFIYNNNLDFEPTKYKIVEKSLFGETFISIIYSDLSRDVALRLISEKCKLELNE